MRYLNLLFVTLFTLGCSSEHEDKTSEAVKNQSTENEKKEDDQEKPKIYTAFGYPDGYPETIYIAPKNEESIDKMSQLPPFNTLHVIPRFEESDGLERAMTTVVEDNFSLWGVFKEYSGDVVVFYDKNKRLKAATYTVINGKPNGIATAFTPKGRVLVKREYDQGKWVKSIEAPACADWTYNANKSNLKINDLNNGKSNSAGVQEITLISSVQENADFNDILDKSSYVRPFQVNGNNFSGRLLAYYSAVNMNENGQAFELNFINGKLHGDVKIYDNFIGLTLHEVFDTGALTQTVFVANPEEMDGMAKPILYFYPEDTIELTVNLNLNGTLTHTYPKYKDQWRVTACPDGTLFDENGQEYYALYWEGENNRPFTLNQGSVVKGENTVAFLEESLATLGLNRREANEFIMYWLPRMENNAYNLIHFSSEEYEAMAQLHMEPKPETVIRVMMVYEPLDEPIAIPEQSLEKLAKERIGFTVVEWGGKEVNRTRIY